MQARRRNARPRAETILWCFLLLVPSAYAGAASLRATVVDRDGAPVPEVAVYALPSAQTPARSSAASTPRVMDQQAQQFIPHILVIQTGEAVEFPNHDTVSHHVYSFSKAKTFELPLYKGTAHPPVVFERPGVVDLGCNIHDQMEAHIVVVDTPYFSLTGPDGRAELTGLPAGRYAVRIYTPRLRADALPAQADAVVDAAGADIEIPIEHRLRPPHVAAGESLNWSHY